MIVGRRLSFYANYDSIPRIGNTGDQDGKAGSRQFSAGPIGSDDPTAGVRFSPILSKIRGPATTITNRKHYSRKGFIGIAIIPRK
jgi:hypothetical protein